MKILALVLSIFLVGCQTAGMEYYQAVEKIAIAQSQAQQAKSEALSKIAASGDNSAAGSAVMALALMQSPNMQVIPQQSAALEWSKAVLPVVGSLGAMWISSDAQKTTARHAMTSNLARIEQEGNKTTALYDMLGSNNDNMLNLGLGSYDAINVAGQQAVDLGLGLGLASINSVDSGGSGDNSAVLDALGNLQFPNYTSNFQGILDAIGNISIPNYDSQLDAILTQINNSNTVWVAGVNCVNNQTSGVIGVGGANTALPVCPQ
tara:strand:- start:2012 stop:2800 length:789 start_codon:yes stop_codon:yes gene_type:complete